MPLLFRLARGLLGLVDALLQWLVPPRHDRICYASLPDYTDNAYYLFLQVLRTRRNIEHVWLLQDPAGQARVKADFARLAPPGQGHRLRVVRWHSREGYFAFLSSGCVAHTHGLFNFSRVALRGRLRLGLWHGMPIKCIGRLNTVSPNPTPQFATHYFATSPFFRYVLAQAFGATPEQVRITGLPRNDALVFPQSRSRQAGEVRERLKLPSGCRLLAWLPTYRAEGKALCGALPEQLHSAMDDLPPEVLEALLEATAAAGCELLVKLHPYERSGRYASLQGRSGVHLYDDARWRATGLQLYDVLAMADGLISDVSSVLLDFALTGRPMGCMGFSAATYPRDLVFPIEEALSATGTRRLDNADVVRDFVARVVAGLPEERGGALSFFMPRPQRPAAEQVLELMQ